MQGNIQAMDRSVRLTSALDRYHRFSWARIPAPPPYQAISPNSTRGEVEGKFSASQPVEITRNRERISETLPPQISPPRSYGGGVAGGALRARGRGSAGLRERSA